MATFVAMTEVGGVLFHRGQREGAVYASILSVGSGEPAMSRILVIAASFALFGGFMLAAVMATEAGQAERAHIELPVR
jgi:hypothetical protein